MAETSPAAATATAAGVSFASSTAGTGEPASKVSLPAERPYFIPATIDYAALPEPVRRALVGIVGPAYEEFVERALTPMERAAGNTLVFLLTMEAIHQFEVASATGLGTPADVDAAQAREKAIEEHLRLVSVKQVAARFVLRLNTLRDAPYTSTLRRLPKL